MLREEFEKIVAEEFEHAVAQKFQDKMHNVALLIEDEPSLEVRKEEELGPHDTLLGYYRGIPATARGALYGVGATLPDTITLYQLPIEEAARDDAKDIRQVVRETIWHEVAHYFGMDESAVRKREDERDIL